MSNRKLDKGFVRATTPDPLSLDAFIGWLEKQPGEQEYDWSDCTGGCLFAQYALAHGFGSNGADAYSSYISATGGNFEPFNGVALETPHTFGAALERARALSASMKSDAA